MLFPSAGVCEDAKYIRGESGTNNEPPLGYELINNEEVEAFKERISAVAEFKNFPFPGSGRNVPWPPF